MSDRIEEDGSFINSIVGEGTRFSGEVDLEGLLRIDGDFSGTIRSAGKVLVGKGGRAECTIRAGTVVIGGIVKGNIFAEEKVIILSTGMIIGNINTPRLIAEEGVILNGNCLVRREGSASPGPQTRENRDIHTVDALRLVKEEHASATPILQSATEKTDGKVYSGEMKRELSSWKG